MKNAIITGCNRGVGAGIRDVLLQAGYTVYGLNRTPSVLPTSTPATYHEMELRILGISDTPIASRGSEHAILGPNRVPSIVPTSSPTTYHEIGCNIADAQSVKAAIDQVLSRTDNSMDVVIANAGIRRFAPIENLTLDQWADSINTNLSGVFYLAKNTIPAMRTAKGHFVVVGSHAEKYPFDTGAAYCASKGALTQFVDCFIEENRYHGVRATYLSIGSVKNRDHGGDESWKLTPNDIGQTIHQIITLPPSVLVPYMDVRPLTPLQDPRPGIDRLQYV